MNRYLFFLKFATLSAKGIVIIIVSALLYSLLAVTLINIQNIVSFSTADYPLGGKLKILFTLFTGALSSISAIDQVLLFVTAILFGIVMAVVLKRLEFINKQRHVRVLVGSGVLSLASTGCASCGLSLFSIVGLAGAVGALPLGGVEFYLLAIIILIISLYYNLRGLTKECKLPQN